MKYICRPRSSHLVDSPCAVNSVSIMSLHSLHAAYDDDIVHHPLGAASYIFQKDIVHYVAQLCHNSSIKLRVGTQPNSSPHIGTITTFATAFALGKRLQALQPDKRVTVHVDYIDTAPSTTEKTEIDGIHFQKSLRYTGEVGGNMKEFGKLLERLSQLSGVAYETASQDEFLGQEGVMELVQNIVARRDELSGGYSPGFRRDNLGIRAACPQPECGWADKHGLRTKYNVTTIIFWCPDHGNHSYSITEPNDVKRLEFNTPLRTLLRSEFYARDRGVSWIQITGADYAGFYQEQLLWKHVTTRASLTILYTPMIVDWAGSKLSKSLYVREGAYEYLKKLGMEYLVSFTVFNEERKDLSIVFEEVLGWVDYPYRLFRNYSLEYFHRQITMRIDAMDHAEGDI
jgi:hypothetical protein